MLLTRLGDDDVAVSHCVLGIGSDKRTPRELAQLAKPTLWLNAQEHAVVPGHVALELDATDHRQDARAGLAGLARGVHRHRLRQRLYQDQSGHHVTEEVGIAFGKMRPNVERRRL